ncbi:amidase [Saccharopolyspora erythraea NRRL 2338]|uniref:Amidase n=2 Tax=Saccharopolyspora erythraea TaxID=1836 RepID=A4FHN7_SACEN|nr:amidase [Saccharopolyspora erythraea]CAM03562.1 amidase [Saccharopolyspora erythraea NRRL 2338]
MLSDAGHEVEETDVPRLADALDCYGKLVTSEFRSSWPRIRPLLTDDSARHMELSMEQMPPAGLDEYLRATADRHAIVRDWARFLAGFPLVLGPVSTEPPGDVEVLDAERNERIGLAIRLCTATTFAGVPAVAVPTGVEAGVPMGVQIIGPHFREDLCLAAASAVEAALGTFTPVG